MRADEWIVNFLVDKGVTDVFGIPGVVVMDFLYAVDKESRKLLLICVTMSKQQHLQLVVMHRIMENWELLIQLEDQE